MVALPIGVTRASAVCTIRPGPCGIRAGASAALSTDRGAKRSRYTDAPGRCPLGGIQQCVRSGRCLDRARCPGSEANRNSPRAREAKRCSYSDKPSKASHSVIVDTPPSPWCQLRGSEVTQAECTLSTQSVERFNGQPMRVVQQQKRIRIVWYSKQTNSFTPPCWASSRTPLAASPTSV
jgi:hypothetical protein